MAKITGYQAYFNTETKVASILLGYSNNVWAEEAFDFKDFDEYRVVLDLLRNEKPLYFENGIFYTDEEPQGEKD